jgi:hypothetical protein
MLPGGIVLASRLLWLPAGLRRGGSLLRAGELRMRRCPQGRFEARIDEKLPVQTCHGELPHDRIRRYDHAQFASSLGGELVSDAQLAQGSKVANSGQAHARDDQGLITQRGAELVAHFTGHSTVEYGRHGYHYRRIMNGSITTASPQMPTSFRQPAVRS